MTRTLGSVLLLAAGLVACSHDGDANGEAPVTANTQSTAGNDAPAETNEEVAAREERQEEAMEALPEQLDEAAAARQQATEEAGRLTLLVNTACEGIASEEKDVCPLDPRHVRTVRDIENGVAVQLNPNAGDVATMQRRVDCYQAIAQVRANEAAVTANPDPTSATAAPTAEPAVRPSCVMDVPSSTVALSLVSGGVRVELTSETEGFSVALREQARELLPRRRASGR